jgi:cathepsin L
MKTIAFAAFVGATAAMSEIESAFLGYITEYGKSYSSMAEYETRLRNFAVKHAFIQEENNQGNSWVAGHNHMSDQSDEEVKALLTYRSQGEHVATDDFEGYGSNSPVDWRNQGCVNSIQDQGQCGSCWSFSSTASTEFAWCKAHNKLYKLSEQQLVDCDSSCYGCNGGWAYQGWIYLESHYAMSESSYPYTARDGSCKYSSSSATSVKTSGYTNVTADSPDSMKSALNSHVLSVAIEADQRVFQTYSSGIFNSSKCGTRLDHATNVVGWGESSGTPYWIMRNSWGKTWGDKGYMMLEIVSGKGICGIQMEPNYPKV